MSVGPDLGPNCLQRLSVDDKNSPLAGEELRNLYLKYVVSSFLKVTVIRQF